MTEDFVELSIGKVFFKDINHGMGNSVYRKSTIIGNSINNNLFYELFEYKITKLSKWKIRKLSYEDGVKLREKVKEILLRYGIVNKEAPVSHANNDTPDFSNKDVDWLNNTYKDQIGRLGGVPLKQ